MLVRVGLDGTILGTPRTWIGFIDGRMQALDGLMQASPDGAATIVEATFVTAGAAVSARSPLPISEANAAMPIDTPLWPRN